MFLERAKNAAFWENVKINDNYRFIREELFALWEKDSLAPLEVLPYSDFILFNVNGNRSVYEAKYFTRRRGLNAAAILSLIYPENQEYINRLHDIIFAICDEYTWSVPAHQATFEAECTDHLDLFATETGFALAEIDELLGDRLSPLVRDRIDKNLRRRIITPYMDEKRDFWWYRSKNNWSAVCMCSVAAVLMYRAPELFYRAKSRIDATMDYFLSGFGEDGYCLEGIGYWRYGFGFYTVYADMVRDFTQGKENPFKHPKVKNIATFYQKVFLHGHATISFSDGSRSAKTAAGLSHYLHKEYGDEVLPLRDDDAHSCDNCGRWCLHIRDIVWLQDYGQITPPARSVYYGEDAQWFIFKTERFGFAAKAGHNEEPHNHNDIGQFILAMDERQIFADLGAGVYEKAYFRAERYTYLVCASFGHSVPIFYDGEQALYQKNGAQYKATSVYADDHRFAFDMAGAYGDKRVSCAQREFTLSDDTIVLHDSFVLADGVSTEERFILLEEPTITQQGFAVAGLSCRVEGEGAQVSCKKTEYIGHSGTPVPFWMVNVSLSQNAREMTMTITL